MQSRSLRESIEARGCHNRWVRGLVIWARAQLLSSRDWRRARFSIWSGIELLSLINDDKFPNPKANVNDITYIMYSSKVALYFANLDANFELYEAATSWLDPLQPTSVTDYPSPLSWAARRQTGRQTGGYLMYEPDSKLQAWCVSRHSCHDPRQWKWDRVNIGQVPNLATLIEI